MGFAQVRLTLDNSSHALDVEADEVTIGRQVLPLRRERVQHQRQICRLKDVYELLLDTGIGRDGYSVIGQGRIAEIVAAKSSERREIFEEACGIAKYRYRKNEAERRLAAAARIWNACGISWASWRSAWARWSGRAKRQSSIWSWPSAARAWR